jgi:hypothetical protein
MAASGCGQPAMAGLLLLDFVRFSAENPLARRTGKSAI